MSSQIKTPWPQVIYVKTLEDFMLEVEMDTGEKLILCLKELIFDRDAYWRLRQERYFKQVSIDPIGGICWPEGEDLAPDGLKRYVKS